MLVLIMLTFSCHALCNCQGARGLSLGALAAGCWDGEAV